MRILAVTYGLPWPLTEGARIRDYHLLRECAKDSDVFLLSLCKDDCVSADSAALGSFCASVETYPPPEKSLRGLPRHVLAGRPIATFPFYFEHVAQRIREVAEERRVDLVQIEHSFLAPYRDAVPKGCRAVLSLQNIGEMQYASMVKLSGSGPSSLLKAVTMRRWEARWAQKFDHCIAVSPDEARWLREHAPRLAVTVVENGVDCEGLQPLPPPSGYDLLFVGALGYPPNADAAVQFVRHVLPKLRRTHPQVRFVIVGRNPRQDVRALTCEPGVELHSDVPDVLPFYRRASACVVPLRAGGGTRLKILEAMALGRPVVSTPKGCEGLEVTHGQQLLIAASPESMAGEVERLFAAPPLGRALCLRARQWVERRHTWSVLGERLRKLHREVLGCATETVS